MATKKENTVTENNTAFVDPYEDRVSINIAPPNDDEDYEGKGITVSVNGYHAMLMYGEDVAVPRFVKEMLENKKICVKDAKKTAKKFASKEKE